MKATLASLSSTDNSVRVLQSRTTSGHARGFNFTKRKKKARNARGSRRRHWLNFLLSLQKTDRLKQKRRIFPTFTNQKVGR